MRRLLGPDAELQEIYCVLFALGWGAFLLFGPPGMLKRNPVVDIMDDIWPVWVWGSAFFAYGALGLAAYVHKTRRLRQFCALSGFFGWSVTSYFLFRHFLPHLGSIAVPLAAVASALSYWRLDEAKA